MIDLDPLHCALLAPEIEGEGLYRLPETQMPLVFQSVLLFIVSVDGMDLDVAVLVPCDEGVLAWIQADGCDLMAL